MSNAADVSDSELPDFPDSELADFPVSEASCNLDSEASVVVTLSPELYWNFGLTCTSTGPSMV